MLTLERLVRGGEGFIWLRARFFSPPRIADGMYAAYLGRITMADRSFLNGQAIGGKGRFPPDFFSAWNEPRLYPFPSSALVRNGENVVHAKVYVGHEGALAGKPFVAPEAEASAYSSGETFLNVTSNLLAAALMLVIALYHLIIFAKRSKERENLWFALINVTGAFYLANFFFLSLPYASFLDIPYQIYQQAVAATPIYLIGFMFVSFSKHFLRLREHWSVLTIRLLLLAAPLALIWVAPDYRFLRETRWIQQLFLLPSLVYVLGMAAYSAIKRNRDAGPLLLGYSPIFLTTLADVALHSDFVGLYDFPYLTGYAFPLVILSLLFVLAGRFARARTEAEDLNANLERRVEERTEELSEANGELQSALDKLEKAREAAIRDLKMASFVQSSYYPRKAPSGGRWDAAFSFKPMSDVSGDVYDFYTGRGDAHRRELAGMSLFDVSGHGIASGLVAMLLKSIAARAFQEGERLPLGEVMDRVGNDLAREKGDVENYATGLILRFAGDAVEYANAGHPDALFRSSSGAVSVANLPDRDFKGRFIGMDEVAERHDALRFKLESGDSILVYSDGLLESCSRDGEMFGLERLKAAFARAGTGGAERRLSDLMADFAAFTAGAEPRDDVTVALVARA
jgi:sigma-B regulation protein RsbU (phosphoserine phosphatase)